MKEIYSWVPWFRELAKKIAEGGETYLIEKARQVEWEGNLSLFQDGNKGIDPFSFFYFLASKNTSNQLEPVYDSVSHEFEIKSPLPDMDIYDYYIFPTPHFKILFYDGVNFYPDLLWRLFTESVKDDPKIGQDDFKKALEIKDVGVKKLTQTLFLINPRYFLPVDNSTEVLSEALGLPVLVEIEKEINNGGYEKYKSLLNKLKEAFPGCQPYEINMFLYLQKSEQITNSKIFQIDTIVNGIDCWEDFKEKNWVYTSEEGGYVEATKKNWEPKQNGKIARFIDYATPLIEKAQYTRQDIIEMASKDLEAGPAKRTMETQLSRALTDSKLNRWGKILKIDEKTKIMNWKKKRSHLAKPKRGDIILVRTGRQKGRAIGIVLKNDYAESGLNANSRIHVLWINKSEEQLSGITDMLGFNEVGPGTRSAFATKESYKPSFDLINSLTGNFSENDDDSQPEADTMQYPLNQILYGPPGTGKTWNTVNHAAAIIEDKSLDELEEEGREDIKWRFDELKKNGQIEMVTFHQNFTYEDFIQGIRPVLDEENEKIEYELSEGVFKKIADRANKNRTQSEQTSEESWDTDELLQAFAESIENRLESGEEINLFPPDHRSGATIGEINWSRDGKFQSFKLGGTIKYQRLTKNVIKRDYEAFYKGEIKSLKDIKPTYKSKRTQHGNAMYYFALYGKIKQFHDEEWQSEESGPIKKQNYVLIIDEINRGNIARIFGELITLIESSKRIGGDDEATVILPYSQDSFGVPDNLYIIGTMNTADRSIALLDTALRRRFDFVEMMPDSKHDRISTDIEGVDCQELLATMNDRIRFLLDREHQIGHTYFMDVDDMESLAATFKNKIIPLLQEYFYDNWEKIDVVLNGNGFIKDKSEKLRKDILEKLPEDKNDLGDLIDEQKKIYELLPDNNGKWKNSESYQAIYEKKGQAGTGETE